MSWLTDLAGKAENLLNKIDKNAAVVLKDKNSINEQLQDVIWKTTPQQWTQDSDAQDVSLFVQASPVPLLPRSAPSGSASPAPRLSPSRSDTSLPKRNDEDEFLRFLNSSEPLLHGTEEARGSPSGASVPSAGSSSPVNIVDLPRGSHSRSHSQGGMSSMSSSYISNGRDDSLYQQCFKPVENIEVYSQDDDMSHSSGQTAFAENNLLKNEIRCLNNDLALMLQRCKTAEKEANVAAAELQTLRETVAQRESLVNQIQTLQSQLKISETRISTLSEENRKLKESASCTPHESASEITASLEKYKQLQSEHEVLGQETNELRLQVSRLEASMKTATQQNERYRSQVASISSEAEQYRARATRVLQEKEKLIASLQAAKQTEGQNNSDTMLDQELEQMREELQLHRQESATQAKLLQSARNDLQLFELQQEEQRQKTEAELNRLQKILQEERSRRQAAEEDCRVHLEEVQSAKTEMNQQCKYLEECIQSKENEISRLKQQTKASINSSQQNPETAELETRVRNLATSLIQKQGALEALIAERNSLRLKLERVEVKNQLEPALNGGTVLNVSESENVTRQRVPTLLLESPGDTGVARRVKRAYSSLDTLGIRVGVFLRRYPLARILLIVYMVLLHLWVAIVLFSYSPEENSLNRVRRSPPALSPDDPKGVQ
ncbi:golgin subfamily A member 5 [Thrips palmi]|uniref:Golgin subfamily A member 5 n=1 Tax=Thrips palmi TaxID=161013 RepID=A0A6P8ZWR8_THRPL|nr:golgin subfamily A member 5 [Thrips palmi]